MTHIFGLVFFMFLSLGLAQPAEKSVASDPADKACMASSKASAVKLEAKEVRVAASDVAVTDIRNLGSGTGLHLYSVFVNSSATADNTHWEIVSDFNYKNGTCRTVLSRRFEAP